MAEDIKKIINELREMFNVNIVNEVETKNWVNTGVYSLNFLLSGDIEKGIPEGKMIVVAGEQQTGKSILAARVAMHAQKNGYIVLWLDSEHATDNRFLKRLGLDIENVLYKSIDTVEEFQECVLKFLNKAIEKNIKFFIVLDSLGALSGTKEMEDINANKFTSDMGLRAKNIRTAFKQIIHKLEKSKSIFFCVNHIYLNPGYVIKKEMGGGLSAWYFAQIVLFLSKLKGEEGVYAVVNIKSKKNREFIEGRNIQLTINFRNGINKYDGLIDLCQEFEIIKQHGSWYNIIGDNKSYREKDILENENVLNNLLNILKEKTKNYGYSTVIVDS